MEFPMYRLVKSICTPQNRAAGPSLDPEIFFSNPACQHDCIEDLIMTSRKKYSCYVSEMMDRLGYSYDMIKHRQQIFPEDWYKDSENTPGATVTTGGKGEGTALIFENDFDIMHTFGDIICADNPQPFIHHKSITLFQTERHESSPGYTRLKLIKFYGKSGNGKLKQCLFESENRSYYLSSQFLTDTVKMDFIDDYPDSSTSGPSTSTILCEFVKTDMVYSFRCFCPDILERWVSRTRLHGWPIRDIIHEISLLDAHVVPVGFKGSENMFREWRICYSLAELYLMQNLNETQIKVYIILKKLCKSVLNPVCEDMTSYIMKNVVLWMCETHGGDRFTPDLLMDSLSNCIIYLKSCVNENNLPSYMIPERNLLAGRLNIQQREQLSNLLGDLLREGGRMLLRCDKFRDAMIVMYKIPDMFREFSEKRDRIERLVLRRLSLKRPEICEEEINQLHSENERHCDLETLIEHLMHFDRQTLISIGKTEDEIDVLFEANLTQLLS